MEQPIIRFPLADFVKSAAKPKDYPLSLLPEIAVAGRSNVGKSSLLNSLLQRKGLVQVSSTPGRTRLLNFFLLDQKLMLVDLPGYGFAKIAESVRKEWKPMIESYITKRTNLVACLQLFDIRHLPSQEDLDLWLWLDHLSIPVIPILTKADKISPNQRLTQTRRIAEVLEVPHQAFILYSAKDHIGRDRLQAAIHGFYWNALATAQAPSEAAAQDESQDKGQAHAADLAPVKAEVHSPAPAKTLAPEEKAEAPNLSTKAGLPKEP